MQFSKTTFNSRDIRFVKSDEKIYVNPQDVYRSFETGLTKHSYRNFILNCPKIKKGHFLYRELKCFVGAFQNELQFADVLKVLNDFNGLEWTEQIEKTVSPKTSRKPKQTVAPAKEPVTVTKVNPVNIFMQKEIEGLKMKLSNSSKAQIALMGNLDNVRRSGEMKVGELEEEVAMLNSIQIENNKLSEQIKRAETIYDKKIQSVRVENDLKLSQIADAHKKQIESLEGQINSQNENVVVNWFTNPKVVIFFFLFAVLCGFASVYGVMVSNGSGLLFSLAFAAAVSTSIMVFTFSGKIPLARGMAVIMFAFHALNMDIVGLFTNGEWQKLIIAISVSIGITVIELMYAQIVKK